MASAMTLRRTQARCARRGATYHVTEGDASASHRICRACLAVLPATRAAVTVMAAADRHQVAGGVGRVARRRWTRARTGRTAGPSPASGHAPGQRRTIAAVLRRTAGINSQHDDARSNRGRVRHDQAEEEHHHRHRHVGPGRPAHTAPRPVGLRQLPEHHGQFRVLLGECLLDHPQRAPLSPRSAPPDVAYACPATPSPIDDAPAAASNSSTAVAARPDRRQPPVGPGRR